MPVDDRPLLDRLSRAQLYVVAAEFNINHPPDLPKYIWEQGSGRIIGGMVPLLESNGVTPEKIKSISWRTEYPTQEELTAAQMQGIATGPQLYPAKQSRAPRNGSSEERLRQVVTAPPAKRNNEIDRLAKENEEFRTIIAKQNDVLSAMMEKLETIEKRQSRVGRPETKSYWELYRKCQEASLPVRKGMKGEQLEEMLDEHLATRSQCGPAES